MFSASRTGLMFSSFRMTLFSLARSVTNRRADGGPPDSFLIKTTYCQQTLQNDGRRLRGIQFLPCFLWTEFSCPFVSIRGSKIMLIKIIVIGKLKDKAMQARCDEYAKWLGGYGKLEIRELPDSTVEKEGQAIQKELEKDHGAFVVALSEEGKEYTTADFATFIGKIDRKIIFIIGGPYGLAKDIRRSADLLWSLSKLTFTHEIARLLLFEQLFRVLNLNAGGHYHNA